MSKLIQMRNQNEEKYYPNTIIKSGNNYRVYADGYMEYWGQATIENVNGGAGKESSLITYPYPFKNTYDIQITLISGTSYWSNIAYGTASYTNSNFKIYTWNNGANKVSNLLFCYKVSGYINKNSIA